MADETIEVEWIATANKMVQVLDRLEAKFDKQEQAIQKLSDTGKKGGDAVAGSFNRIEQELKQAEAALKELQVGTEEFAAQKTKVEQLRKSFAETKKELADTPKDTWSTIGKNMAAATGAAAVLAAGLMRVAQAQRETVSAGADQATMLDTMARKMQIQAGLTDDQRAAMTKLIIQQSSAAGVTAEVGFQAATQLAGSGFAKATESGALTTILDTIQASSYQGSPDQLVSAFAESLNAYGLEKTNDNLKQVAVAAQSLFKQTDFQLVELGDFAKNASVFKGANLKIDEALAGFTALREVLPAAESGTGLRNFVNKLQAGDITKEQKENLKRIGVSADQVDFVGENLVQVIQTIKAATDKMPEADRNAALGKMFGTENVASARLLLQSSGRIQELQASQRDEKQFMADRNTAAQGMQAEANRIANERLINIIPVGERLAELNNRFQRFEDANQAVINQMAAENRPFMAVGARAASTVTETANTLTGGGVIPQAESGLLSVFNAILGKNDEQIRLQQEANELLKQQAAAAKPQPAPQARPKEAPLPAATAP